MDGSRANRSKLFLAESNVPDGSGAVGAAGAAGAGGGPGATSVSAGISIIFRCANFSDSGFERMLELGVLQRQLHDLARKFTIHCGVPLRVIVAARLAIGSNDVQVCVRTAELKFGHRM